MMMMMMCR